MNGRWFGPVDARQVRGTARQGSTPLGGIGMHAATVKVRGAYSQRGVLSCALAIVLFVAASSSLETEVGVQVSKTVFQYKGLSQIVAVLCNNADAVQWQRSFGKQGSSRISTPRPSAALEALRAVRTSVGVFLHVGCTDTWRILQQSSAAGLFSGSYHWVLAGNTSTLRSELVRVAEALELAVDSEVTLAVLAPGTRTVHLVDAYRVDDAMPLLTQLSGTWTEVAGVGLQQLQHFLSGPTAVRRRNLQGIVLRAGVLVHGFRDTDLASILNKPKDNNPLVKPVAAFSHILTMHLQDLLNVT